MNQDKLSSLLLHIIKEDTNVRQLIHYGLSYREIAELIEQNITSGNLNGDNDVISLTKQGEDYLNANRKLIKERDKSKWIDLDLKHKITKIDKDDVFLPTRDKLSFLK
ncbi:hypothetical protein [Chitinophaga sp. S165]|uniref:hypothetical protein n=1 Tax=Chitinophaga sp. S165 TaxID=2135462 RepID=UPI000D7139AD|nr:hypothetical protein [Chitinophaga sp. S165]PWV44626.1 hypothetical protein C7475_1194 [Chitinophaga sp. S165]